MIKATLTLMSATLIGIGLQCCPAFAQERMGLESETYNFSQPTMQYNPATNSWQYTNTNAVQEIPNTTNNKKLKKSNKRTNLNQINNTPAPIAPTEQRYYNNTTYQEHSQPVYTNYTPQQSYYQSSVIEQAQRIVIPSGTPVSAYVDKMIDADDVTEGQEVTLLVQEPVKIDGTTVIKANTPILAQVTKRKNNCIFGIPGEIAIGNFKIQMRDGTILNLRGSISHKGQNRYWVDFVAWFFLWPVLFVKGEDGKIQSGVHQMLYTVGETYINQ